ncbi:hypothetical protein BC332_19374 [Capsicum chinense]|nr:hypothetical protein BC332_19374 [Capsicum chinense]
MEFNKGDHVEVASKEDGFLGSYFEAILISYLAINKKYIVQYKTLVKDDLSGPLEEVVSLPELRPFRQRLRKYAVYFENFGVECVYHAKDLRVHQDWIDGTWISSKENEISD